MDNSDLELKKIRRRMRGPATFFIVVSIFTIVMTLGLAWSGRAALTDQEQIGRMILGVGFFFAGLGAWHGSRIAAISILGLLLITPIMFFAGAVNLKATDWVRSVLYIGLTGFMVFNAFLYHNEIAKRGLKIGGAWPVRWVSKLFSVAIVGFLAFGIALISIGTSASVQRGSEISQNDLNWLVEKEFLLKYERPLFMYLDGAFSIDEGGSLLTDSYVGAWWPTEDGLDAMWLRLGQICEIKELEKGNFLQDAIYSVHDAGDQNSVQLWLSIEGGLHKRFISRMSALNNRKMRPEIREFCDKGEAIDWEAIATKNGISQNIVGSDDVSDLQRAWLIESENLIESEEIILFYSYGKFAISEGGAMLTSDYVGGWWVEDNEPQNGWLKLGDACEVVELKDEATETDSFVRVTNSDAEWVKLSLPASGGQSQAFVDRTLELVASVQTEEQRAACAALEEGETEESDPPS